MRALILGCAGRFFLVGMLDDEAAAAYRLLARLEVEVEEEEEERLRSGSSLRTLPCARMDLMDSFLGGMVGGKLCVVAKAERSTCRRGAIFRTDRSFALGV